MLCGVVPCCAVLCCAVLCCAVLCCGGGGGGGGVARVQFLAHFGRTHTPFNRQGLNEGPAWGCPTASRSYSRAGCR